MVSRRVFLLGALGTAVLAGTGSYIAIEDDVLPGRIRLAELVGTCDVDAAPPSGSVGTIKTGTFRSAARHSDVGWLLALPPGQTSANGLPVVLVLHGRGGDHTTGFEQLGLHRFLAAHVQAGGAPFALAAADGGDGYWHPRASGDDPLLMLTTEFVPMLATLGLRTASIGVLGWSMGGYGALLLARQAHRDSLHGVTIAAAAAGSPALFTSYRSSAAGAFDDAADYAAYGTLAEQPDVGTTPLYVACGTDDAFTNETKRYRANVSPTPSGRVGPR
ncbi:MAG TPA: alpha/beta hydrolase-fold protein, partial [Acidothermaceae bacterium]